MKRGVIALVVRGGKTTKAVLAPLLHRLPVALPLWAAWYYRRQIVKVVQTKALKGNKDYGQTFLEGGFEPQRNLVHVIELEVLGEIPEELQGVFLRNGPNPYFDPVGGYHWFDGDGMLHACRISDGRVSYSNSWVNTERLQQEKAAGWPMFLKLGDHIGLGGLAGIIMDKVSNLLRVKDLSNGKSTANTALVVHADRLLALNEDDLPYAVRVNYNGLVETIGRVTFKGKLNDAFTAHPKVDPVTGKLHFFWSSFPSGPVATYGCIDADGYLEKTIPLPLTRPVLMHDFAITANHSIFLECPLVLDVDRMMKNQLPVRFAKEHGTRIGLLRHDAQDASGMVWFDMPAFVVMHTANAWEEEDGTIKVFVGFHENLTFDLDMRSNKDNEIPEDERPRLSVITLNPQTNSAHVHELCPRPVDFPTINHNYLGRKCRFTYMAHMVVKGKGVRWDGISKFDMLAGSDAETEVAFIKLPPGCFCGEAVFVPRYEEPEMCDGEDDGFLMTYVHDESTHVSSLVIWDAATMADEPLAQVLLPHRVPYGFHGLWLNETQFQGQLMRTQTCDFKLPSASSLSRKGTLEGPWKLSAGGAPPGAPPAGGLLSRKATLEGPWKLSAGGAPSSPTAGALSKSKTLEAPWMRALAADGPCRMSSGGAPFSPAQIARLSSLQTELADHRALPKHGSLRTHFAEARAA